MLYIVNLSAKYKRNLKRKYVRLQASVTCEFFFFFELIIQKTKIGNKKEVMDGSERMIQTGEQYERKSQNDLRRKVIFYLKFYFTKNFFRKKMMTNYPNCMNKNHLLVFKN